MVATTSAKTTAPKVTWSESVTSFLYKCLKKQNELFITRVDKKTGKKYVFEITHEYLHEIVLDSIHAARYNPRWGPRNLVAVKLLVVGFGESCLDPTAMRLNTNGSLDMGLMQVNSCNWFGPEKSSVWFKFCTREGYNPYNMRLFWNPRVNMAFAATLNEIFVRYGQKSYKYYGSERQRKLYTSLITYCGYKKLALEFNDGQYYEGDVSPFLPSPTSLMTPDTEPVTVITPVITPGITPIN